MSQNERESMVRERERAPSESGVRTGSWVDTRLNHSERNLVRQKWTLRGAPSHGITDRLGRSDEHSLYKVVPRAEGRIVKTFLFRNFPEKCSDKVLIAKFQEVGPVVDLFCPKKKDAKGKRFGFVRMMLEAEDGEGLLDDLNTLWVSSYKLQVLIPQFDRKATMKEEHNLKREQKKMPLTPTFVEEGRSFAYVVKGCCCQYKDKQIKP